MSSYTLSGQEVEIDIGPMSQLTIEDFFEAVYCGKKLSMNESTIKRLDETRKFVDFLLEQKVKVYGLSTGYADLRDKVISPEDAGRLSENILLSHDAGIGRSLPLDIVRGAMILRANSLSKGYSAFEAKNLQILIDMINADIIPDIPCNGSLGASGDLALLARLGRAMQGHDVTVYFKGVAMKAGDALAKADIVPWIPSAKEGLALTNGTSFMAAMMATAYLKQLHIYENIFAMTGLYLTATRSVDVAFSTCIQEVRKQPGQIFIADLLKEIISDSPLIDREDVQNDYSQRCLPQIFGPKIEDFLHASGKVFNELNAATDNPLIFRNEEISEDITENRIIRFNDERWAVISGGNFHGEVLATVADELVVFNAKIALTLERHLTFLNNPNRNKKLPAYLVTDEKNTGLYSGFMIPQYTGNDLTQKICALAHPVANFNLTSANESEDIVSYGTAAAQKLLEQLHYLEKLTVVYLTVVGQGYSIARQQYLDKGGVLSPESTTEKLFAEVHSYVAFPVVKDVPFDGIYEMLNGLLNSGKLRTIIGNPLCKKLGVVPKTLITTL